MSHSVVIAVAPNGAYKSRSDHPHLPIRPDDIAEEAYQCLQAGASMLHLHVRDDSQAHTLDASRYVRAMDAIRHRCGDELLIQATTEAAGVYSHLRQIEAICEIEADFLSIAVQEVVGQQTPSELEAARQMFQTLEERNTALQFIVYEPEQLQLLESLKNQEILSSSQYSLLFVLGRHKPGNKSAPEDLNPFLHVHHDNRQWMVCAFGQRELECMTFAASNGGHTRVGFENNICRPDGSPLENSAESVRLLATKLKENGFEFASPLQARQLLTDKV